MVRKELFLWLVLSVNILIWLILIGIILSSIGPYNTTSYKFLDKRESSIFRDFFPEGFGFFTRDPLEEFPLLYQEDDGALKLLTKANGSPANFFGLKRSQRSIFSEMGQIISKIPNDDWSKCTYSLEECIAKNPVKVFEIQNNNVEANLCGTYYIATKKPIPWAWRNSFRGEMPQRFVKLIIKCQND